MTKETFQKAQKLLDTRDYFFDVRDTLINAQGENCSLCAVHFDPQSGKPKFLNKVYLDDYLKTLFISTIEKQIYVCEEEFENL